MSLSRAIFGAKPLYGTPPFAGPVPQTGGAASVPAPGEPQHGISGFLNRVFNPTNALGQFGQALVAGGGNPATAMAYMMQQRNAAGADDAKFAEFQRQYDYQLEHPKPHDASAFDQELAANGIMPGTPEYADAHKQHLGNELDQWVNINVPDVGTYYGPRSGIPGALGKVAPAALGASGLPPVGTVMDDPRKGGAGSNASGNFLGL